METKSFEILIHSQYAFDVCRAQVHDFEDCRQSNNPTPKDPQECRKYARQVMSCYKEAEKMHPICLAPFNDARECLFKADGNLFNCRDFSDQYVSCQKDQEQYSEFLKASTTKQKKPLSFDFFYYRGHFDKYMG